ncbi:hypothetical protein SDC9_112943 [bioreactor metagenome]|uniref:Uncharacterized protein n=1 Tax=bioreactor metagenome TaxID=1076179 RepID=A0A645BKL8_9ZZZZ
MFLVMIALAGITILLFVYLIYILFWGDNV